jgi:hypothetical protein
VLRISRVQAGNAWESAQPPHFSLLWSDPPLGRQLRLIRRILPQARRIGVLYDQHSEFLLEELRQAAQPLGLEIVASAGTTPRQPPAAERAEKQRRAAGPRRPRPVQPENREEPVAQQLLPAMALIGPNAVRACRQPGQHLQRPGRLAGVLDHLLDRPRPRWPRSLYPERFKVSSNRRWLAPWASNNR